MGLSGLSGFWRMVDALGPDGDTGLMGGRDTGSIKGDVVHPPVFFRNFVFDKALAAGLRVVRLESQLYFNIAVLIDPSAYQYCVFSPDSQRKIIRPSHCDGARGESQHFCC